MQRRAAVAVAQLAVGAGGDEPLDLGDVAGSGRGVKAGVRADFRLGGRDLRERLHACGGDERGTEPEAADAELTMHPGTSFPANAG